MIAIATSTQRLELAARVCDAVHHAHQKGVIHRDLKPAKVCPCPDPCDADLDDDGTVGINDFLDLLAAWGPCS